MSLVATVQTLLKRNLSTDEVQTLNAFQKQFELDDDDPLLVVLSMMACTQIIAEAAPALLQQKVDQTIELHRTALREQAVLVAKDLVGVLTEKVFAEFSNDIKASIVKENQTRWAKYGIGFGAGVACCFFVFMLAKYTFPFFGR